MIEVTIDSTAVNEALDRLEASTDFEAVLNAAGASLADLIRSTFISSDDPWGSPWEPLSPNSRSGQPLRDTSRLMNSITAQLEGDTVRVGTNVCYAIPQQFGFTATAGQPIGSHICGYEPKGAKMLAWKPRGGEWHHAKSVTIPPRPFMPITPDGQAELSPAWEAEIVTSIEDMIKSSFL